MRNLINSNSEVVMFIDKCATFWVYWADANPEQAVKVYCSVAFITGGTVMLGLTKFMQFLKAVI